MDLHFRRLTLADVPAVLDLTADIWDGDDYMPGVIERWIRHPRNYTFGAFLDPGARDLAGMAQVRWFSPGTAWIEGGRVRPSLQKLGIGIQIAAHAIQHIQSSCGKACLYDTSSRNLGSIAIAKQFGFIERDRVRVSIIETGRVKLPSTGIPHTRVEFISVTEAMRGLARNANPPVGYISNGWSWAPLEDGYLAKLPWRWARLGKAIALIIDSRPDAIAESAAPGTFWFVVHGDPTDAASLVTALLGRHLSTMAVPEEATSRHAGTLPKKAERFHSVFCPEPMAPAFEVLGFHPFNKEPEWVVLFEKRF
jgi:hypothetical protein